MELPPSHFYFVSGDDTEIRPGNERSSNSKSGARIRLAPGFPLERLSDNWGPNSPYIAYDSKGLRIDGVLHAPALTHSFTLDAPKWTEAEKTSFQLAPPIEVAENPGGEPFVWIAEGRYIIVNRVGRKSNGYVFVTLLQYVDVKPFFGYGANMEIQGWIPEFALRPASPGYGRGAGGLHGRSAIFHGEGIPFPAGTRFYDRPDGRVVGVVIEPEQRFEPIAEAGAWTAVTVWHRLGKETLWVRKW